MARTELHLESEGCCVNHYKLPRAAMHPKYLPKTFLALLVHPESSLKSLLRRRSTSNPVLTSSDAGVKVFRVLLFEEPREDIVICEADALYEH